MIMLAEELQLPAPVREVLSTLSDEIPWTELTPMIEALNDASCAQAAQEALARTLAPLEGVSGLAQLAVMLAAAVKTRIRYAELGVDDEIFLATMGCFRRFLIETKQRTGQWCFDRAFWCWRQTAGVLFRIDSLEFEYHVPGNRVLPKGINPLDKVLSVHIPSDAVLSRQALDETYVKQRCFVKQQRQGLFARGEPRAILCGSWLLAPSLQMLLQEGSGIRLFAADYILYAQNQESTEFYQWLFEGETELNQLPEHTTLQKKVKQYLAAGGKIGTGYGLYFFRKDPVSGEPCPCG